MEDTEGGTTSSQRFVNMLLRVFNKDYDMFVQCCNAMEGAICMPVLLVVLVNAVDVATQPPGYYAIL